MKKLIAIVLAVATALSLCVACGGGGSSTGQSSSNGDKITLTIGLPASVKVMDYENNALTNWLEEQTGYELKFEPFSGGTDIATQISTRVVGGEDLPDIMMDIDLSDSVINDYGRTGVFIDLSKYYDDRELSKNFWERLEKELPERDQQNVLLRLEDPETEKIYSVPTLETSMVDTLDYQMWINVEWLDKLGLEKPTDEASLLKVLRAFKTEDPNGDGKLTEIPLFGSQAAGLGADVINWLVNQYVYMDDTKNVNLDENGKVTTPFTTNEYRKALQFINTLLDEGLMLDTAFSTTLTEMPMITTPSNGVAMCGIFAGHLSVHVGRGNELLYQYEPLQTWGNAVYNDNTNRRNNFITDSCEHPDEAFKLMMTMYSEEASYRIRYGEYGVNWVEADEGAISSMGLPCTIKILRDPMGEQNSCTLFDGVACTLMAYSEGETAQVDGAADQWAAHKSKLHAESRRLFDEAAAEHNPPAEQIAPAIIFTQEEKDEDDGYRAYAECCDYYRKSRTAFCKGEMDPFSDADWQAYLDKLNSLGLKEGLEMAQYAYDRQTQ